MSGVAKAVNKVFKKIRKNPLKAVVAVAAVWFTAGTAMNYFAAPAAGIGSAAASQASSMWTTVTSAFSGAGPPGGAIASPVETAAISPGTAMGEAMMAAPVDTTIPSLSLTGGEAAAAANPLSLAGGGTSTAAAAPGAGKGMFSWMERNPMATMMLGQAGAGAYQGYLMDKQEEREDERLQEQGLMGFDRGGRYGGIVAPRVKTDTQATEVARPEQNQVAVPRRFLPELYQNGQIVRG